MVRLIFISILSICFNVFSQYNLNLYREKKSVYFPEIDNKINLSGKLRLHEPGNIDIQKFSMKKNLSGNTLSYMFYSLLFINPMLVIEDKKAYFGLTKEISVGHFPYGRLAFEYSYIFREKNTSHLRASYNLDIVLGDRDFYAFVLTPGAGYFTDTKNKGWFGQISAGLMVLPGIITFNPYLKYRHTFLTGKPSGKTDIDDLSLGMGFVFYLN